jgi:hypothetical protein
MASLAAEVEAKRRELEALDAKVSQTVGVLYVQELRCCWREKGGEETSASEKRKGEGRDARRSQESIRSFHARKVRHVEHDAILTSHSRPSAVALRF